MDEVEILRKENDELKMKVLELEDRLKKYTNSEGHKRYYEKNKEVVKEKGKSYLEKLKEENPEKLKEYRRTAYLNRKSKFKNQLEEKIDSI